jgi:hypothetical protein
LPARLRRLLPGLWLGLLLTVAAVAAPAAFALLDKADAGRVAARVLAVEAHASLAFAAVLMGLQRWASRRAGGSPWDAGLLLATGALFCTVAGYFAVLPMMEAARAGQGRLSFGQLHAISAAFYGVKLLLVAALAWRAAAPFRPTASS